MTQDERAAIEAAGFKVDATLDGARCEAQAGDNGRLYFLYTLRRAFIRTDAISIPLYLSAITTPAQAIALVRALRGEA